VVLSDLSTRATAFSRFAAALNGLTNVETVNGDCFAPVAGRRFDQIIANPPFYVTPAYRMMCVNNGLELDQFCRRLASDAPRCLNEGGWFQMLCEWIQIDGQPWEERLSEWFQQAGCDVWVVKGLTVPTDRYAHDRIRECYAPDPASDRARYQEWMAYYRERQITAVHRGFIVMRRRGGRNWIRLEESDLAPTTPFGEGFAVGFDNLDFLASAPSDAELLAARFQLSPGITMTHRFVPSPGGFRPDGLRLSTTSGLPRLQSIDMTVAAFLDGMNGVRTLGDLAADAARQSGAPFEKVAEEAASMCRLLLERGFLQRAAAQPPKVSK
jgi:hypothetical protein